MHPQSYPYRAAGPQTRNLEGNDGWRSLRRGGREGLGLGVAWGGRRHLRDEIGSVTLIIPSLSPQKHRTLSCGLYPLPLRPTSTTRGVVGDGCESAHTQEEQTSGTRFVFWVAMDMIIPCDDWSRGTTGANTRVDPVVSPGPVLSPLGDPCRICQRQ